jgi:hypothetical protein
MATPSNHDGNVAGRRPQQAMSPEMFANLGAPDLAYIRPITVDQGEGQVNAWGIFAANGSQLGVAPQRDLAFAAAVQNELVPVSVH